MTLPLASFSFPNRLARRLASADFFTTAPTLAHPQPRLHLSRAAEGFEGG